MDDLKSLALDPTEATEETLASCGTAAEVMAKHNRCGLCGGHLHFSHVTDFSRNITQETAKCPECGIKTRRVIHKLQ